MDEIERSQIGKRSEPLQGWDDKPKKGIGTNYPPMRAKGVDPPSYASSSTPDSSDNGGSFLFFLMLLFIGFFCVWIFGMMLGFW
jgi:hypothetical protein